MQQRQNLKWNQCHTSMRYLDHGNILLRRSWLNLARHLDHGFDQSGHILVHLVVGAIEVGSGRRADLLRLQLNNVEKKYVNGFKNTSQVCAEITKSEWQTEDRTMMMNIKMSLSQYSSTTDLERMSRWNLSKTRVQIKDWQRERVKHWVNQRCLRKDACSSPGDHWRE